MISITSIFRTVQGEGILLGMPMTFIRMAGCSIGCPQCDTNYALKEKLGIEAIINRCKGLSGGGWIWITGGEPTDQKGLLELASNLKASGYLVALATSGHKKIDESLFDFVSVSPHKSKFEQMKGSQLNVVPGLNGLTFQDVQKISDNTQNKFQARFITPMDQSYVLECWSFIDKTPDWRLGIQAHKVWCLE